MKYVSDQNDLEIEKIRHSTAHLMAAAIHFYWPEARFGVGPSIKYGFYYDVELPEALTPKDLTKIEQKMREFKKSKIPYERLELTINDAISEMEQRGQTYKVELLNQLKTHGSTAVMEGIEDEGMLGLKEDEGGDSIVSFYRTGEFLDLCRGPHVERTSDIGEFKLTSIAGAYWRGKESNPQLQRIYGIAFSTKEELEKHLHLLEEAKKRDHRKLGQELDLFTFSPLVGSGLPMFTPKGTVLRLLVEELVQSLQQPLGYQRVLIPHITKNDLYKVSGHWEKFQEDLFHVRGKSGEDFCLKPMNCPHHTQIYAGRPRSYRDLPLRFSEVTSVYRDELPGTLHGLSRVRMITQDDAHVFCMPEQVHEEALKIYSIIERFYRIFGMKLSVRLSLRSEKNADDYLGEPALWQSAEDQLRKVLEITGVDYYEEPGEAAFYGPKIDFTAKDALEREWQLATIQLDFNIPERFDLTYTDSEGRDARPVMLHRAVLGSLERFMSILIEHYAGAFPVWLAPVQIKIIPIADRHYEFARQISDQLLAGYQTTGFSSLRIEIDESRESMQKKIRNAQLLKIPYMLIIGDSEIEKNGIAVRLRKGADLGFMTVEDLLARISGEIVSREDTALETETIDS